RELGLGKNLMEAQINRSIDMMIQQLEETNDGITPFDISKPLQLCVGNIINETLFGYHFEYTNTAKVEFYVRCVDKILDNMKNNFWVFIIQAWPWTKYLPVVGQKGYQDPIANASKYHDFIEEEVNKVAKNYDRNLEPTNFIHYYLLEMEVKPGLDFTNLYAIVVDFWMAGMETTGTTLKWALLYLVANPRVQDKIREELLVVVGQERRLELTDKPSLPYFNAAIAEVQRCANIVLYLNFYKCTSEAGIGGKLVPKGALVQPQICSVMMDENVFENPSEFRPERFLEDDGKTPRKEQLDHLVPFGMGRRQCIGEGLARAELFLVLGTLLLKYRFEPTGPVELSPIIGMARAPRQYKCRIVPV
ncbi:hypothetical protein PMAYCL1PPCAC_10896, partial [Pristionchus mayeri]